jgi:hypothetical protein
MPSTRDTQAPFGIQLTLLVDDDGLDVPLSANRDGPFLSGLGGRVRDSDEGDGLMLCRKIPEAKEGLFGN